MIEKNKQEVEAISAIADYITNKEILDKEEVRELEKKLDIVLASFDSDKRFFKRII